ncbi:Fungal trans [Geosmithia morbida]|uniref:Fungal trans n=1 Tax=Geosmithia morbida TaxID=1094350 RepID=A0A9P5CY67_9HYPO|nr:Fungal trans [Geosmithia morbida]KAF4120048.1 Fungal trans [Geosmithia morbida]
MAVDMEMLHAQLYRITEKLGLSPPPRLQSIKTSDLPAPISGESSDSSHRGTHATSDIGPSCDNSPVLLPEDDTGLPHVPIHSLYRLTKLRALRSPQADPGRPDDRAGGGAGISNGSITGHTDSSNDAVDDLVSRGQLALDDAERLFRMYMDHLDHFMYGIGGAYATLDALRRGSRLLAVSIFTVAALHMTDTGESPTSAPPGLYGTCMGELRHLMAATLFQRRMDHDDVRAMCIASYWLSDVSWNLSGYAIRRAAGLNLAGQHVRAVQTGAPDAVDAVRLWYVLYICDQHLSTLYGRHAMIRYDDDAALSGWEAFRQAESATDEDQRLASQVALLNIMQRMRAVDDTPATVLAVHTTGFGRQLDRWLAHWSVVVPARHNHIGGFPRNGVLLHYHFATLHLHAQVFQGADAKAVAATTIAGPVRDSAVAAVTAATAIVEMLITNPEMRPALVGMPSYMHAMTGYACMFLARLATQPHLDDVVQTSVVVGLVKRLIALYRSAPVGRWHLVKLMGDGLDKIIAKLQDTADNSNVTAETLGNAGIDFTKMDLAGFDAALESDALFYSFDDDANISGLF